MPLANRLKQNVGKRIGDRADREHFSGIIALMGKTTSGFMLFDLFGLAAILRRRLEVLRKGHSQLLPYARVGFGPKGRRHLLAQDRVGLF